jgi:LmbE family N-acetylglucosaminyl deacetylase
MKKILVISPHIDDDVIACGGTMALSVKAGDHVRVLYLTSRQRKGLPAGTREKEAAAALAVLGVTDFRFLRLPEKKIKPNLRTIKALHKELKEFQPSEVYTPNRFEDHYDHVGAYMTTIAAVVNLKKRPKVLFYEIWTPNVRVLRSNCIESVLKLKMKAIAEYRSQYGNVDIAYMIQMLNEYRGESLQKEGATECFDIL